MTENFSVIEWFKIGPRGCCMRRRRRLLRFLEVVLILLCLTFFDRALVYAQGLDRSISKTGPTTATNNAPFDYTIVLTLLPGFHPGFVFTDTLAVGGSGGTIGYEVFECPLPPCPPNPPGDIPIISESPITGTIPVGSWQSLDFTFAPNITETITVTTTYVVLVRVTPNFSPDGVITNTVTLPPDSNPSNNTAEVVTRIGQQLPVPPSVALPTLTEWGMLVMVVIFGGTAFYFMRRRQPI